MRKMIQPEDMPRWSAALDAWAAHPWATVGGARQTIVALPTEFPGHRITIAKCSEPWIAASIVAWHNAMVEGRPLPAAAPRPRHPSGT